MSKSYLPEGMPIPVAQPDGLDTLIGKRPGAAN